MNTYRRIRTIVVAVDPCDTNENEFGGRLNATTPRFKPSDLLPWSDPYIASLVEKLQDEVRHERDGESADLEVTWDESFDFDADDDDCFRDFDDLLVG